MFGHVTKLLTAYHHAELSVADRRRVEDHVASCARCRQELDTIGEMVALVSHGLRDHGVLVQDQRVPEARSHRAWVLVTIGLVLVVAIGTYSWRQYQSP